MEPLHALHGRDMTVIMNTMHLHFLVIGECWLMNLKTKTYFPRKNFYAIQQVSKFVLPGSWQVSVSEPGDSLTVLAFYDPASQRVSIVGINKKPYPVTLNGTLANLPAISNFEMYYTNNTENVHKDADVTVKGKTFKTIIPANCIFTLTGAGK